MKKVLIIGGTQFVGRNLVEQLLLLGKYDLTLFNRGKTNPELFPEVKQIVGDRNTDDLHKVAKQNWDCIIDISCYYPNPLEDFVQKLKGKVERYIFVSTGSVYDLDTENKDGYMTEDFPKCTYTEDDRIDKTGATYGQRKVACEDVLLSQDWLNTIILRPALIVGHYDHTDRLYYWFYRTKTQDSFLLPNEGKDLISYTDVLDFSKMMIQAIEVENKYHVYNSTSYAASLGKFVQLAAKHLNKNLELVNVSPAFIDEQKIAIWTELPLWVEGNSFTQDSSQLQKDFDFTFSTIEETTERLMDYYGNHMKWRDVRESKYGQLSMTPEREAELMKLLK